MRQRVFAISLVWISGHMGDERQWRQDRVTMDYLQVFELSIDRRNSVGIQKVIHTQECPPKSATYYLPIIENPSKATIWVIDSEDYCMMLLLDEY